MPESSYIISLAETLKPFISNPEPFRGTGHPSGGFGLQKLRLERFRVQGLGFRIQGLGFRVQANWAA